MNPTRLTPTHQRQLRALRVSAEKHAIIPWKLTKNLDCTQDPRFQIVLAPWTLIIFTVEKIFPHSKEDFVRHVSAKITPENERWVHHNMSEILFTLGFTITRNSILGSQEFSPQLQADMWSLKQASRPELTKSLIDGHTPSQNHREVN